MTMQYGFMTTIVVQRPGVGEKWEYDGSIMKKPIISSLNKTPNIWKLKMILLNNP